MIIIFIRPMAARIRRAIRRRAAAGVSTVRRQVRSRNTSTTKTAATRRNLALPRAMRRGRIISRAVCSPTRTNGSAGARPHRALSRSLGEIIHSITRLAIVSSIGGISIPSAAAAF